MGSFLIARMKVRYSPNHYLLLVARTNVNRKVYLATLRLLKCTTKVDRLSMHAV